MITTQKTIASAGTPTIAPQKTGLVFTTTIAQAGQGGQCDCDNGLRRLYGIAQPCHKCRDGQRMAECQQASDYMEIYE